MRDVELRTVPGQDMIGRPGAVAVVIRDRQTVLTVPDGEAAHLFRVDS